MFTIFEPRDLPSTKSFIDHWRELAAKAGYPGLFFVAISHRSANRYQPLLRSVLEPFDAVTPLVPSDYLLTIGTPPCAPTCTRRLKELNFGIRLNALKKSDRWRRPTRIRTLMS